MVEFNLCFFFLACTYVPTDFFYYLNITQSENTIPNNNLGMYPWHVFFPALNLINSLLLLTSFPKHPVYFLLFLNHNPIFKARWSLRQGKGSGFESRGEDSTRVNFQVIFLKFLITFLVHPVCTRVGPGDYEPLRAGNGVDRQR